MTIRRNIRRPNFLSHTGKSQSDKRKRKKSTNQVTEKWHIVALSRRVTDTLRSRRLLLRRFPDLLDEMNPAVISIFLWHCWLWLRNPKNSSFSNSQIQPKPPQNVCASGIYRCVCGKFLLTLYTQESIVLKFVVEIIIWRPP